MYWQGRTGLLVLVCFVSLASAAVPERPRRESIFSEETFPPPPPRSATAPVTTTAPVAAPAPATAPATKPAVPSDADLAGAEELAREVFAREYGDDSSTGRGALARKLLAEARRGNDLAERYVLLRESARAAAAGGDAPAADLALDHLVANFQTDALEERLTVYQTLARSAPGDPAAARSSLGAAEVAADHERFDLAEQFLALVDNPIVARAEPSLAASAREQRGELRERMRTAQQVAAARATLEKNPDDPAANAILGRYLCLAKGDWEAGLPLLARSNDSTLKPLAEAELRQPVDPAARMLIANRWWELRKQLTGAAALNVTDRAADQYEALLPELTGLRRTLAEKRLAEALRSVQRSPAAPAVGEGSATEAPAAAAPAANVRSVAYVCDASGSMMGLPFDLLKSELRQAIEDLSPPQQFNVIFFQKGEARSPSNRLLIATPENKRRAYEFMEELKVAANSDPIPALVQAMSQAPQVVYFLSDGAFDDNDAVVHFLRRLNQTRRTRINTIAFFSPSAAEADRQKCEAVLSQIAREHGGSFRIVLTTDLTR